MKEISTNTDEPGSQGMNQRVVPQAGTPVVPAICGGTGPVLPETWHSATEVRAAFERHIAAARAKRAEVLAASGPRTVDNTLQPFNDMLVELDRVVPLGDLMSNVHPERDIRQASEDSVQGARKFLNELRLDPALYQALAAVPPDTLDAEARRSQFRLLLDYRRSGVDRDEATRRRLAVLYETMVAAGQAFARNIREGRQFVELGEADLTGLPEDYVASHRPGPDGKIRVSTDYSDFFPFLTYSPREDLRRELYFRFDRRAYPANEKPLRELMSARHEYATLLGYGNWADYSAEDKMVKQEKVIVDFLDRVASKARPRAEDDLSRLRAKKKQDFPAPGAIHEWDRLYYARKVRSEEFDVDSREVREYFEFGKVKEGILSLAQELFKVRFEKVDNVEVWYDGVEAYDVLDGRQLTGRFYLDLHPRPDKYSHMAVFHMLSGLKERQVAAATLVGNFPGQAPDGGRALLEHGEVLTFLHEFGHVMHHLLSGQHRWVALSGFNTEFDFVETPSQLLEEWGWDAGSLAGLTRHYQTGKAMPALLVEKMRRAEAFGRGIDIMRQVFYAKLSLAYYNQDPVGIDLLAVLKQIKGEYSPFPYEENTHLYTSFGHLDEYGSMYYTYLWSRALARDIFTVFQARGMMDEETAMAYRKKILEPGGAVDAGEMVRNFLGRDYSFDAFKKWVNEP